MSCNCGAKATYNAKPKDNNHYDWCDDSAQNYGKPPKAMSIQPGGWNVPLTPQTGVSCNSGTTTFIGRPTFPAPATVRPPPHQILTPNSPLFNANSPAPCACGKPIVFGFYDKGGWWTCCCPSQGCYDRIDANYRMKLGNWCEIDKSGGSGPISGHWAIGHSPATVQYLQGAGQPPTQLVVQGVSSIGHQCSAAHFGTVPAIYSVTYGAAGNSASLIGTTKYWCASCMSPASITALLAKVGSSVLRIQ